jgi:hypothetical protein
MRQFLDVLMAVDKPIVEHKTFFFSSFSGPATPTLSFP